MPRRVKLEDLGERGAIEVLRKIYDRGHPIGIGDDCGVLEVNDLYVLITTDVVNQQTHIPAGATPYQIGWYLVAINLSDIAAMGGMPLGFLTALSLPRATTVDFLRELARGIEECCRQFGIPVLGGDTKESSAISLAGTAVGRVKKAQILLRRGARAGDLLVVTGELGRSGLAYRDLSIPERQRAALEAVMRPYPRVEEGKLFAESGAVTSCMDISDGLGTTLAQMGRMSGVQFEVSWEKLPLPADLRRLPAKEAFELALYTGGDYELAATVDPAKFPELKRLCEASRHRLTAVGGVAEHGANVLLTAEGQQPLEDRGWEHFRSK